MNSYKTLSFFLLLFLFQPSCKEDTGKTIHKAKDLTGRWELVKGWRNGRETQTLKDTYYEFSEDGQMRTNLSPTMEEVESPFSFSGDEIKQKSDPPFVYIVDSLTDTVLILRLNFNNIPFRLELRRADSEIEPELEPLPEEELESEL